MLNDVTPFFKPLLMINDKSKKVNIFSFNLFWQKNSPLFNKTIKMSYLAVRNMTNIFEKKQFCRWASIVTL